MSHQAIIWEEETKPTKDKFRNRSMLPQIPPGRTPPSYRLFTDLGKSWDLRNTNYLKNNEEDSE